MMVFSFFIPVFGEGVKFARGAIAILAAATTVEICLEHIPSHEPLQTKYCSRTSLSGGPQKTQQGKGIVSSKNVGSCLSTH